MAIVEKAYQCDHCGTLHLPDSETFVRIKGNVYVGESGGVIGNNIEGDTNSLVSIKVHSTILCRKNPCVTDLVDALLNQKTMTARCIDELEVNRALDVIGIPFGH